MYQRHETGKQGEDKAVEYLKRNNYTIIEKNFLCRQGEIDIIAKDNIMNEYVFVEVKTRNNNKYGNPIEAVNWIKQKRILNSTKYYIYTNRMENKLIRFDVISIYNNKIIHYKNCEFKYR